MQSLNNNVVFSPAKLNMGLKIPFRYENGYHHLESVFVPLAWGDTLEFFPGKDRHELELVNEVPEAYHQGISQAFAPEMAEKNLILRAVSLFEQKSHSWGFSQPQKTFWRIKITKRIPSPCGLGGGSSNAAAVLRFLVMHALGKTPASGEKPQLDRDFPSQQLWNSIASDVSVLGSDIPFFLKGVPAYLSGKGAELSPIHAPQFFIIVGIPPFGFSTATLYQNLQKPDKPAVYTDKIPLHVDEFFGRVCIQGYFSKAEKALFLENDFWEPAKRLYSAEMAEIEKVLTQMTVLTNSRVADRFYAGLTGSGSAVYVAALSEISDSATLLRSLTAAYPTWQFVLTEGLNAPIGL